MSKINLSKNIFLKATNASSLYQYLDGIYLSNWNFLNKEIYLFVHNLYYEKNPNTIQHKNPTQNYFTYHKVDAQEVSSREGLEMQKSTFLNLTV